uniref:Monocarboxylate transporter 10-like n=1 Tax=Petromyzon marinus TaxID=7757 RepID=A0AAJ7U4M2_PETMA|nr:monocarboxylate transporter 10-like [Petromyzon marinus]
MSAADCPAHVGGRAPGEHAPETVAARQSELPRRPAADDDDGGDLKEDIDAEQSPGNGRCPAKMTSPCRRPEDDRVQVAGVYLEEVDGGRQQQQQPQPPGADRAEDAWTLRGSSRSRSSSRRRRRSSRGGDEQPGGACDFQPPEGGFGWVVMVASMWCNGAIFGIHNSFGILFLALLQFGDDSGSSSSKASFVGALAMGMLFLCAPVVSLFTGRFGCRITAVGGATVAFAGLLCSSFVKQLDLLYLTYGVVFAVGAAFAFQPSLVILGHYFKRRLGLVNGIVMAGSSVFTVALSYIMKHMLVSFGLVLTLQALAALMLPLIVAGFAYRPLMPRLGVEGARTSAAPSGCGRCPPLRIKTFCVWVSGVPIALFGYFVPYVHLMNYVKENLDKEAAQHDYVLIICIAVSSGLGRLGFGWLADIIPGVKKVYLQIVAFLAVGLMSALIPMCSSLGSLVAVCIVMGLFDGCITSLMAPIAFELVGPHHASQAIGIVLGLMSVPMTVGPTVAGLLRDWTGSYDIPFYLAGVPPLVGSGVLFFVPYVTARAPKEEQCPEVGGARGTPLTPGGAGDTAGSRGQLLLRSPAEDNAPLATGL